MSSFVSWSFHSLYTSHSDTIITSGYSFDNTPTFGWYCIIPLIMLTSFFFTLADGNSVYEDMTASMKRGISPDGRSCGHKSRGNFHPVEPSPTTAMTACGNAVQEMNGTAARSDHVYEMSSPRSLPGSPPCSPAVDATVFQALLNGHPRGHPDGRTMSSTSSECGVHPASSRRERLTSTEPLLMYAEIAH